nr:hypothetical protein CFP56_02888 [Quercus suber]
MHTIRRTLGAWFLLPGDGEPSITDNMTLALVCVEVYFRQHLVQQSPGAFFLELPPCQTMCSSTPIREQLATELIMRGSGQAENFVGEDRNYVRGSDHVLRVVAHARDGFRH